MIFKIKFLIKNFCLFFKLYHNLKLKVKFSRAKNKNAAVFCQKFEILWPRTHENFGAKSQLLRKNFSAPRPRPRGRELQLLTQLFCSSFRRERPAMNGDECPTIVQRLSKFVEPVGIAGVQSSQNFQTIQKIQKIQTNICSFSAAVRTYVRERMFAVVTLPRKLIFGIVGTEKNHYIW